MVAFVFFTVYWAWMYTIELDRNTGYFFFFMWTYLLLAYQFSNVKCFFALALQIDSVPNWFIWNFGKVHSRRILWNLLFHLLRSEGVSLSVIPNGWVNEWMNEWINKQIKWQIVLSYTRQKVIGEFNQKCLGGGLKILSKVIKKS